MWLKVAGIFIVVVGGCGLSTYLIWQAMGTTLQQIVLGTLAVGFVWNCILPVIIIVALLVVFLLISYFVDRW